MFSGTIEENAMENHIIKIVQVRSRDRIVLPRDVMRALDINEGDFLAFLRDQPGVRMMKVTLER